MRPLDFLGRIKIKIGLVILLAVATAFAINEYGRSLGVVASVRMGLAALLSLGMVQLLGRGMTRPLREMAAAAQTIAKGRYGMRVRATSRDEVGELARAFNAMAADLAEVDRQRRELVANVSHELRTPITGLQAVLENILDGVSAPDLATLSTALAQTERLGRLVAQLLDLSRLDSGARPIEPEPVELGPLCDQAVREASLARDDVSLSSAVSPLLGVHADPALLGQVLANLLDNGVRHSPPGGLVRLEARPEGPGVRLSVSDQGPGIPEPERPRVFERFSRLDTARAADAGGAGLGLAIVKEIVELHGGSIRVADSPVGCRMVVDLPGRTTAMSDAPEPLGEGSQADETTVAPTAPEASGGEEPLTGAADAVRQSGQPPRETGDEPSAPSEDDADIASPADAPGVAQAGGKPASGYVPPPLFPRPDLPETPRRLLFLAAAVGLLAAVALPYSRPGLGIALVAVAAGVAVLPAARHRITPWTAAFGLLAYALVAVVLFRDAGWLIAPMLLAGFGLAALAVSGGGHGWLGVIRGGLSVALAVLPLPWFLAAPLKGVNRRQRLAPVLAGLGLAAVLIVVFGLLFASADAVFSSFVARVFTAPVWASSLPFRLFVFVVFAAMVGAATLVALRPPVEPVTPNLRGHVSRTLWLTPLVALNLLFASFVAVQITTLFGGNRKVVETAGLTYAEYARSGFFELVTVSVFVLAIVAVAAGVLAPRGRERWLLAGLLGLLCGLTMVILTSALHRLGLYTDAYGLSRLRASVGAAIWWLGAVFALVLVAGGVRLARRGASWLPRTLVLVTGLSLLVFAVWNPDLRVAETQLHKRGVARLDVQYLSDLGAEAVPVVDRLPEPMRSCLLNEMVIVSRLGGSEPWNGWNLAREHARDLLRARPLQVPSSQRCQDIGSPGT
ncbi:MAG: histidine kinase [Sphaerisporangium sp.]|nr:histidine kinase [Sphaerisporangium sp.]